MQYARRQYLGYIQALKRHRSRRSIRSLFLLAVLVLMTGIYTVLQASHAPLSGPPGPQPAGAKPGPGEKDLPPQPTSARKALDEKPDEKKRVGRNRPSAGHRAETTASARQDGNAQPERHLLKETYTVSAGDTLIRILRKAGLAGPEAYSLAAALSKAFDPTRLQKGQELIVAFVKNGHYAPVFYYMGLRIDASRELRVMADPEKGFAVREVERRLQTRPARAAAIIQTSLYQAALDANLPHEILMQVLRAYSYNVDFQRDIRPGDSIEVLYEEKVNARDQAVTAGNVLFAALHTNGRTLRIYRFETAGGGAGFFNAEGESVRKALMLTPIEGARLSSGYGMRKHPIMGYSRMHEGLDFAAPAGTPVMAAGDGIVEYAGPRGSYGNYVRIRHPNRYQTIYAHLSRYAETVGTGVRVRQGEIIGYVGSTGMSTGPHLHYEVLHAGNPVNPAKIKTPPGRRLEGEERRRFLLAKNNLEKLYASLAGNRQHPESPGPNPGKKLAAVQHRP